MQVCLFESLAFPATPSSCPDWPAPPSAWPTSPLWAGLLMPASQTPLSPPTLPPLAMSPVPPSLPPALPSASLSQSLEDAAPSWDAWSKDEEEAGFKTPTTCPTSDTESINGWSSEAASGDPSGAETDVSTDFKHQSHPE